jgi:hypothetical protein
LLSLFVVSLLTARPSPAQLVRLDSAYNR